MILTRNYGKFYACRDLQSGMGCIRSYTLRCMQKNQRENFNALYKGVNMAIMELCQDGPYQDGKYKYIMNIHI